MTTENLTTQVQFLQSTVDYLVAVLVHHGFVSVSDKQALSNGPGQANIPNDPRRTETGMGPLLNPGHSNFV